MPDTTGPLPASIADSSPPVVHVSRFSIFASAAEIGLTLATNRQVIDPRTGAPAPQPAAEWVLTGMMSPTTAEQLRLALEHALKIYTDKFGAIPRDPDAKMQIAQTQAAAATADGTAPKP